MPLLKSRRVIAAKLESSPGTPATLASGTDGMINVYDAVLDADLTYNERMSYGGFGRLAGVVGTQAGSIKFKIEAYGSGTSGTAPAWADVLFPSSGMTQASNIFSPNSAWSAQQAATIAVLEDGVEKKLVGAMGSWQFHGEDGKIPYFEFTYKGIWTAPTTTAMFTPQFLTSVVPPRFASATLSIGSYTPVCSKFSMSYGTKVEMREDVTQTSGFASAIITDRKTTGSLDPEEVTPATYDAFGIWLAGTTATLTCTFGASGTGMTIAAPALQYDKISEGDRNGIVLSNLSYVAIQSGSTVDNEVTITF